MVALFPSYPKIKKFNTKASAVQRQTITPAYRVV